LLPPDAPVPATGEMTALSLTGDELAAVIAELPRRPLLAGREGVRLSLAGAQEKLPVVLRDDRVALPLGNTPSTHIIKPEPERYPGLVANEFLCMTLAQTVGLNVPGVATRTIGGKPCIVVQRYDRFVQQDGTVARIHQEDFCQALGFPPERKYQQEGGPLLRDCIAMLREWSTAPVLDVRDFLDGLIFSVLIGNADAHGKNYSLLYRDGQRRLAPFYDLICTLAWPELSKVPAMKIGQSDSMETVTSAHWQKMTREAGLAWPLVKERLVVLARKTIDGLRQPKLRKAIRAEAMSRRVAEMIEERSTALLRALEEGKSHATP
jgi:serine/threonine-protein kinase HipA